MKGLCLPAKKRRFKHEECGLRGSEREIRTIKSIGVRSGVFGHVRIDRDAERRNALSILCKRGELTFAPALLVYRKP